MRLFLSLALVVGLLVMGPTPVVVRLWAALPTTGLTLNVDASTTDRLWKETGMTTHPADTEAVAMWDDVGDATTYAIGQLTNNPAYRAALFNSLGSLDFDGTNDALSPVNDAWSAYQNQSVFMTVSTYTVFVSFIMEGNASNDATIYNNTSIWSNDSGYGGLMLKSNAGTHTLHAYNYGTGIDECSVTISQNTKYVAMIKHTGGNISLDVNNGALTCTTASGDTASMAVTMTVGASVFPGTDQFFNGKLGEMAFYNTSVTGADLSDAWTYFMDKWVNAGGAAAGCRLSLLGVGC